MNVILIGSSIFEQWETCAHAFPGCTVINAAVGGTKTRYWVDNAEPALRNRRREYVAYYCGSNDFNDGVAPGAIIENTLKVRDAVRSLGSGFIYYFIIKAPQKMGKYSEIDSVNGEIADRIGPGGHTVDFNPILCPDIADVTGLYQDDDLHLTPGAYARMAEYNIASLRLKTGQDRHTTAD